MNIDRDFIQRVAEMGNSSYQAGFEQGVLEGKRQAYAEVQQLITETFPNKELPS